MRAAAAVVFCSFDVFIQRNYSPKRRQQAVDTNKTKIVCTALKTTTKNENETKQQ